jgi:hypothetical protein
MDKFVWWKGKDLMTNGFLPMLMSEGAENVIVKFHPKTKMLEVVEEESGESCGTYNDAHECPIDCP